MKNQLLGTFKIYFILIITCTCVFTLSCKKNKSQEPLPKTLTSEKDSYTTFEIVQTNLNESKTGNLVVLGKANGKDIKISIINDAAIFIVPEVSPGVLEVSFKAYEASYKLSLNILKSATTPETPEVYVEAINKSVLEKITTLVKDANNTALSSERRSLASIDAKKYLDLNTEYTTQYQNLSPSEKAEFAKVISANIDWINEFKAAVKDQITQSLIVKDISIKVANYQTNGTLPKTLTDILDYEEQQNTLIGKWLTASYALTRNIAKLAVLIYAAPVTASIPIIGTIATGVAIGYMLTEVCSSLSVNLALTSDIIETAFAPYKDLSFGTITQDVYSNLQEKIQTPQAKFRNLIAGDDSNSSIGSRLKTFIETFKDYKTKVSDLLDKIPNKFRPSFIVASLKSSAQEKLRLINNKYISISNISNSKVNLTSEKLADGTLKFKVNTNEKSDQVFTYDINYSNNPFSTGLKQTVNAKIIYNGCPINSLIGTWHVQDYYNDQASPTGYTKNLNWYLILKLYSDGKMTYQFSSETTVGQTTFSFNSCRFSWNFFGCTHSFYFDENVSSYTVGGCGGFHHHTYTKQ